MYIKFIYVSLVTLATLQDVNGRRTKKKHIINESPESTPQPNVVTYSTFGFKDVGAYDSFVPSSPDYATYLTSNNRDSSTRLYAPAFPSSIDSTGLGSYYDPQPDLAPNSVNSDGYDSNVQNYPPVSINFFTSPNYDTDSDTNKNIATKEVYDLNNYSINSPTYGTKLNLKNKNVSNVNQTDYNIFNSVSSVINGNTAAAAVDNVSNNYPILSFVKNQDEKVVKTAPSSNVTPLKFPKVIDFTSVKNYYPTNIENNKFTENMHKPYNLDIFHNVASDSHLNQYENNKFNMKDKEEQSYSNKWHLEDGSINTKKVISEVNSLKDDDVSDNYPTHFKKNKFKNYKEKVKNKQYHYNFNDNAVNKIGNSINGYGYSTDHSNITFQYDSGLTNRPFNSSIDEIVPAGSSLDFVDYQFPEKEFSTLKTSNIKSPYHSENFNILSAPKSKYKLPEEYVTSIRNLHTTPPTLTSHWGNIFKDTEFTSYKNHPKKHSPDDETNDDIVHIPKRQISFDSEKIYEKKPNDWGFFNSYKTHRPVHIRDQNDWTKDFNNRFKSEEDLLGLRNHDTPYSSYTPSFKPSYDNFDEDLDVKKLSTKWKQNFLKAKYSDSLREYETFASEPKPVHVPIPKPYSIEVPHPVVVPVPQPYPVRVPIPKPVAVPIIRELTVPVVKPVPYPVVKKVPYPIEKLVPVPVEKQVPVPVVKPYPVHIPHIRPVFHHTKPHDEREIDNSEDDYFPRPDSMRPNNKRHKNTRNRARPSHKRPQRTSYQDRSRQRVTGRRPVNYHGQRPRRPYPTEGHYPHRYRDDFDDYDSDSEFEMYCKRTGKC